MVKLHQTAIYDIMYPCSFILDVPKAAMGSRGAVGLMATPKAAPSKPAALVHAGSISRGFPDDLPRIGNCGAFDPRLDAQFYTVRQSSGPWKRSCMPAVPSLIWELTAVFFLFSSFQIHKNTHLVQRSLRLDRGPDSR